MRIRWHKWIRKSHRYLGVLIGIQFLAWTIGGLYFSWTDLDKVHGSDWLGPPPVLGEEFQPAPLDPACRALENRGFSQLNRIELLPLNASSAVYRISYFTTEGERSSQLVDASSGEPRGPLTETECSQLARERYAGPTAAAISSTEYLEATGPHDEYRELPLPAYAFTFDDSRSTTIYVAPANARVTSVRNKQWRAFDFLWMLHTMDYQGRDNFNHLLLKAFAVFGLVTILSGFALFIVSARLFRKR